MTIAHASTTAEARVTPAQTMARAGLLLEPGTAFMQLEGDRLRQSGDAEMDSDDPGVSPAPERHDVIVIGGGQSGLSAGYHLARQRLDFVILDAGERIGDAWRKRWDSLRLFTAARFCGLDGMRFPGRGAYLPTKDEMADFLESYVRRFSLPVKSGARVDGISRSGDRYVVTAGARRFEARHVVIAAAGHQKAKVPGFATELDASIRQLHSSEYKNPTQLRKGSVLLVGAGNSGAELAMDLRATHKVWLAGKIPGEIPFKTDTAFAVHVLCPVIFRGIFHRLLSVDTPIGRKVRPNFEAHGGPLIRTKSRNLDKAGVMRVPRVAGVRGGKPVLDDGRVLDVENVIWCTGYGAGLEWTKLPIFAGGQEPQQYRGVVAAEPGLYFVGLFYQHAPSSAMVHGVGRDARRVAATIAERVGATA
jgi:putative flavoprotein involved in K+ transport